MRDIIDRLIGIGETANMVGLSRSTVLRLVKQGLFPRPVHASERRKLWSLSEIAEWIEERKEERGD